MKCILQEPLHFSKGDNTLHIIEVTDVEYLEGYKLLVTFDTGEQKVVDLEDRLEGEVFEPLRDLEYFRQVFVDPDLGTICWPNEADFAPDTLYTLGYKPEHIHHGVHFALKRKGELAS